MEIRSTRKRSEAGLIPNDWDVVALGRCLRRNPTYGINAAAVPFDSRHHTYVRITDITEDGRFLHSSKASVAHQLSAAYLLEPNDLVFARTGASVGKSYLYDVNDGLLVFAGFLIRISPDPDRLVPAFLKYVVQSRHYWNWVKFNSMRSGQPGVNGKEFAVLPIPLPPTVAEQEAIAGALGDADAWVESLEKLIAKKRRIKHGVMQQLLSGDTRLPGSSGIYEMQSIADLESLKKVTLSRGKVISKTSIQARPGDFPIYSSSIHNDGLFGRYGDFMFDEELITWSVDGGGNFFHRPKHKFSVTNVCGFMRVDDRQVDCRFLAAELQFLHARKSFDYQTKAHPSVIRKEYVLWLPPLPEQRAIAAIIATIDADLRVLQAKLHKARHLKQGMMQSLLTGKVRLV